MDATVITAASRKQGAAGTFKGTFGFHPLAAWLANTDECLAMELREGNAGANTVADHLRVLDAALAQIPCSSQAKILVRVDGAGATHGLLKRLQALNTTRRTVRYTVGWTITPEDERAIARLPEAAWETSLRQDGEVQEGYFVAELTGLSTREGWPKGMRLIVRRVKPPPAPGEADRVRAEDRLALLGHRNKHPAHEPHRRHPPGAVPRRPSPRSRRGRRPRAHQQGDGAGEPAVQVLANERELDAHREPRRRSRRLAAAADPPRPSGPRRRRAGHDALPPLPPARRLAHHARRHHLRIERTWPC